MSADQVERELKLGAWPDFALPDLEGAIEGVEAGPASRRELVATYYDTRDLDLLRRGATLRFRRGEPPGDVWTAKLPSDAAALGLARREMTVRGERDAIPVQFADLARGWALGQRLVPVARLRTVRLSLPLCDGGGRVLATLDDDFVTVTRGRRVVARFRELEVELVGDAPDELIAAVDERLRAAGAEKVPQIPKLSRALGRAAALPWRLAPPERPAKPTMAAAARERLVARLGALVDLHAPLVLDAPGSAGDARLQAGGLRHALDAYAPLFDPVPPSRLAESLDWLTEQLSAVAELDAVLERVHVHRQEARALGRAGSLALEAHARAARDRARARLVRALRDRRYTRTLQGIADLLASAPSPSQAGSRRVAPAANKFVRSAWRALREETGTRSSMQPVIERLAASVALAGTIDSPDAAKAAEQVERLAALGRARDDANAVAARARSLARRAPGEEAWAAGVIAGGELARADASSEAFDHTWEKVADKATWSWSG